MIHTKVFGNFRNRQARVFEPECRCTRPDIQFRHALQQVQDVLGNTLRNVLLVVSGVIFTYQWHQAHKIVTIRVIDGDSSNVTIYKAYQKSIKGNRFESLDGKSVLLGEAERVEFIEGE